MKHQHRLQILIVVALALVYFPFADKAFTVDDTMFIKAAEQILVNPLDFYGDEVNWYGIEAPHYLINKNPPLISYLIAGVASVFGFNEIALHSFFFLSIALSAIGIFHLGRQFNANPLTTTILATFTPVFLVHGTNVMSDSTMLMFWIWGLVFWKSGLSTNAPKWFVLAGLAVSFGILTKYTCIFLLPLLIFSGVWTYRRPNLWLIAVLIPLLVIVGFENYTRSIYGKGLLLDAMLYANDRTSEEALSTLDKTLTGLSFLGGCFPIALLLAPFSSGRSLRIAAAIFLTATLAWLLVQGSIGDQSFVTGGVISVSLVVQFCAFSTAGFCLVFMCFKEVSKGLTHDSAFLLLWFSGIFVFVCYLNWTINARSYILLVPVVGLLLARRLDEWGFRQSKQKTVTLFSTIGLAGLLAVSTVYADYAWSNTARVAARDLSSRFNKIDSLWFQGHWGFQYYMEELGFQPMDFIRTTIQPGEYLVIPLNNANLERPDDSFYLVEIIKYQHGSWLATMNPEHSAGFYGSAFGVMPYSFGKPLNEEYLVFRKSEPR